jgi:hypothetical protein
MGTTVLEAYGLNFYMQFSSSLCIYITRPPHDAWELSSQKLKLKVFLILDAF